MFSIFDTFHQAAAAAAAKTATPAPTVSPGTAPAASVEAGPTITQAVLQSVAPRIENGDVWITALEKACGRFLINTPKRLAAFLSEVAFESGYFVFLDENLNYSAQSLLSVFPSHFTAEEADDYARQPEKIANRVYADRMGNGPESSGDGWTYHGRGLIQITGKYMYQSLATGLKMSLADAVTYADTKDGACMSAAWFWSEHGLNALADTSQYTMITIRINGGTNGLADRKALWMKAQAALGIA